jgi:hypothetical protein
MTSLTVVRRLLVAVISVILGIGLLAGCSGTATGELGENQKLLATCPPTMPVDSLVFVDGSSSDDSKDITSERMQTIQTVARRTAVCGLGHLTVRAFSAGSAATALIYDADLDLPGATDNARLRRVPAAVTQIMRDITARYKSAIAALPDGGSDIAGLYRLIGEQNAQLPGMRLEVTILTDGLNNVGVDLDRPLTKTEARALADTVPVPKLPAGDQITVIGVGRVVGTPLSSSYIAELVAFYDRLCHNTGVGHCLTVTDGR